MPATVERVRIRLRKNDQVEVLSGKDAGKRGKVLQVLPEKGRVLVQGVNFIKRHTLHVSNLMVVCAECGKRTRIGSSQLEDGRRTRICRKCKGTLDR
jgi:large subunit ribosomal protein L24